MLQEHVGTKRGRVLFILAVANLLIATGCASYRGTYLIDKEQYNQSAKFDKLHTQLDNLVRDFGFRILTLRSGFQEKCCWYSHKELVRPEFSQLAGSRARIMIVYSRKPLRISVVDYDNVEETEFIRVLKQRIERLLEEQYGIRGLQFRRQHFDPLG